MLAQKLRHRVTIQQLVPTETAAGEPIGFVWQNFRTSVPAEIVPLSGREYLAASAEQAEVMARATIRRDSEIDSSMRLVFEDLSYNILSILPDPTFRRHLTLMLSKGLRDEPTETTTIVDGGTPTSTFDDFIDGGAP